MDSVFVLWLPFLDLNQRPPMITPTSAEADVKSFVCHSYECHFLMKTTKLLSESLCERLNVNTMRSLNEV